MAERQEIPCFTGNIFSGLGLRTRRMNTGSAGNIFLMETLDEQSVLVPSRVCLEVI